MFVEKVCISVCSVFFNVSLIALGHKLIDQLMTERQKLGFLFLGSNLQYVHVCFVSRKLVLEKYVY